MRILWAHFRAKMLELVRIPGLWVPMLGIPCALFLFFAPSTGDQVTAIQAMVAYAAFGVLGVAFFQFGVLVAADRETPWEVYLRTLPVAPPVRLAARILAGLPFALVSIALLFVEAALLTPVQLAVPRWVSLCFALLLASIPFGLLGLALGYWAHPRAANAIANLLWIILAYAGGVWGEPIQPIRIVSPYTPTRLYIDAIWPAAAGARLAGPGLARTAGLRRAWRGPGGLGLQARRGAELSLSGPDLLVDDTMSVGRRCGRKTWVG